MIERISLPYKLRNLVCHLRPGSLWRASIDVTEQDFCEIIDICLELNTKSFL